MVDLLNNYLNTWDSSKLHRFLALIDIHRVERVSIRGLTEINWLHWMLDKKGHLSIKLTYWFSKQSGGSHTLGCSDISHLKKALSDIWGLKLCSRFNVWLWWAIQDCLPTFKNLFLRWINYTLTCFCINHEESLKHILCNSSFSQMAWSTLFHGGFLANVPRKMMDRWILSRRMLNLNFLVQEWLFYWHIWLFFGTKFLFKVINEIQRTLAEVGDCLFLMFALLFGIFLLNLQSWLSSKINSIFPLMFVLRLEISLIQPYLIGEISWLTILFKYVGFPKLLHMELPCNGL